MLRKRKPFYIQSKPPQGVFVHHSTFGALQKIANNGYLKASKRGEVPKISVTTDPGRFLSPMPMFATVTVDGFVEWPAEKMLTENLLIPCLYRTFEPEIVQWAKGQGYTVFNDDAVPAEYKYVMRFCVLNEVFLRENEWVYLGHALGLADYKVYIHPRLYNRFIKSPRLFSTNNIFKLTDHPKV